ncbi:hypothetical protein [Phreatobacter stygius]|nr:hypothetical protein [Phreatobacter stygius]
MAIGPFWRSVSCMTLSLAVWAGPVSWSSAAELPPYMNIVVGGEGPGPADTARQNVLALNRAMFGLYDDSSRVFRRNILAQHPVILAMFSGAGGRFILYRPGMPPLEAPSVPVVYQLLKSIGHSTMVLPVVAGPHVDKPAEQSWRGPMAAFRAQLQAALDGLDKTGMRDDWRPVSREILASNIAFIDDCFSKGVITFAAVKEFTEKQGPRLKKIIAWAAETQVAHWMGVVGEWKTLLGADWDKAYAASNTIYVARQNNILFSVLAQFFGPEAINSRLMLIETISFTTTPEDMLQSLTRIIGDRTVGALFFGNSAVMDYELMGGNARDAIVAEAGKRGMTPFLPPLVPFGSKQWPTLITPGPGPASLGQLP